ncbi:hypothetical protein F7734_13230 [Scytonema sp. UIC 10036]|nr:hypothetical protein [Scytonema sp. UIC 10036]
MKCSQLNVMKVLGQAVGILGIGSLGVLAVTVGQIFFIAGITGKIAINTNKTLKSEASLFRKAIGVGGISIGVGIILLGTSRKTRQEKAESEIQTPVVTAVIASKTPIACEGCKHYHGIIYNGVPFFCAMHPYGYENNECPDWEEKS